MAFWLFSLSLLAMNVKTFNLKGSFWNLTVSKLHSKFELFCKVWLIGNWLFHYNCNELQFKTEDVLFLEMERSLQAEKIESSLFAFIVVNSLSTPFSLSPIFIDLRTSWVGFQTLDSHRNNKTAPRLQSKSVFELHNDESPLIIMQWLPIERPLNFEIASGYLQVDP